MEPKFRAEVRVLGRVPDGPPDLVIRDNVQGGRLVPGKGQKVVFDRVTVSDVDFAGTTWYHLVAFGATFERCDFSRTKYQNTVSFGSDQSNIFRDCLFAKADLRNWWHLETTRFERCQFIESRLDGWESWCAEFVECRFTGPIRNAIFCGIPDQCRGKTQRAVNEFRDNDFTGADLPWPDFRKIAIRRQLWPADPELRMWDRWSERLRKTRAAVDAWPASKERSNALTMIENMLPDILIDSESLTGRDDFARFGPDLRRRIIALLASW